MFLHFSEDRYNFLLTKPKVVYIIIAIACWYYPNPDVATSNSLPVDGSEFIENLKLSPDLIRQLKALVDKVEVVA